LFRSRVAYFSEQRTLLVLEFLSMSAITITDLNQLQLDLNKRNRQKMGRLIENGSDVSDTTVETCVSDTDELSSSAKSLSIKTRQTVVNFATPLSTIKTVERRSALENSKMFYDELDIAMFKQDASEEKEMESRNRFRRRNSLDHVYNEIVSKTGIQTPPITRNLSNLERLRSRTTIKPRAQITRYSRPMDHARSDEEEDMFVLI
jgi:hypothetical protein